MTACYADGSLTWQALLILLALVYVVGVVLWTLRDWRPRKRNQYIKRERWHTSADARDWIGAWWRRLGR